MDGVDRFEPGGRQVGAKQEVALDEDGDLHAADVTGQRGLHDVGDVDAGGHQRRQRLEPLDRQAGVGRLAALPRALARRQDYAREATQRESRHRRRHNQDEQARGSHGQRFLSGVGVMPGG